MSMSDIFEIRGHMCCQRRVSPLVTLKIWFCATVASPAHTPPQLPTPGTRKRLPRSGFVQADFALLNGECSYTAMALRRSIHSKIVLRMITAVARQAILRYSG
jgi:hypothetical protein